jgi:hypothetical protein
MGEPQSTKKDHASDATLQNILTELTQREREILELMAEGCTTKQIATRLGIFIQDRFLSSQPEIKPIRPPKYRGCCPLRNSERISSGLSLAVKAHRTPVETTEAPTSSPQVRSDQLLRR